jgi:DNA-binding transcriptional ArsR family regulator
MAKALAHPLRARLFHRLAEGVASPNELSRELGEPLGNVSYHVKTLRELGCIELVEQVPRRGALEHYYRAVVTGHLTDVVQVPPLSVRAALSAQVMSEAVSSIAAALKAGTLTFDEMPRALSRLRLDEQAWLKLVDDVRMFVERAQQLQRESIARGGATARSVVVALYESAPEAAD